MKVRAASVYANGKRVGQLMATDYTLKENGEILHGDQETIQTDGQIETSLKCDGYVPVAGADNDFDFADALVNRRDVDVAITQISGKIHQIPMRCRTANYKGDQKAGTEMGSFELTGGKPTITG